MDLVVKNILLLLCSLLGIAQSNDKVYQLNYQVTIGSNQRMNKVIMSKELYVDNLTYRYEWKSSWLGNKNQTFDQTNSDYYSYHIGTIKGDIDYHLTNHPYNKEYNVVDKLPTINWEIKDEKKQIGDYHCTKAVGRYRGRVITVYFTEGIPISIGPNNLNGLPGAVVYASSHDNVFEFVLKRVSLVTRPSEFTLFDSFDFGDTITTKDYILTVNRYVEDLNKSLLVRQASKLREFSDSKNVSVDVVSSMRGTLELIYEWELEKKNK